MKNKLLTAEGVKETEQAAFAAGLSEKVLMERGGEGVVEVILSSFSPCPTVIVCGLGKNGGEGKVVARLLKEKGWAVDIITLENFPLYETIEALLNQAGLVVDALLGTGLTRPLGEDLLKLITMINSSAKPVVSIDIPTGIETNSGASVGECIRATATVTFFRGRTGHYLLPGRVYRGELFVKDLGIPESFLPPLTPRLNCPSLWNDFLKEPQPLDHKYSRGPCLIIATGCMPGAIKLASLAARRGGAGLVRVICKREEYPLFATTAGGEIITPVESAEEFLKWVEDKHFCALLCGTGTYTHHSTREQALTVLLTKKPCVLDGGALSSFAGRTSELTSHLHEKVILTPHEGEFLRLFPHLAFLNNKAEKALKAAAEVGAIIVLKGYDTVIASPEGQLIINENAPATLATAGTGDVLAGLITSLLAQEIPPLKAAAAAVWMHGEAASYKGLGLIAEDLLGEIPTVLRLLSERRGW
ncbi:MAG: NAD(P)H-hydrate dehydratase [Alphaproteobacteria bacterium]|nr:NAD(P)H-hydrate dehydratase [Alphaproteobacteria bacterium]